MDRKAVEWARGLVDLGVCAWDIRTMVSKTRNDALYEFVGAPCFNKPSDLIEAAESLEEPQFFHMILAEVSDGTERTYTYFIDDADVPKTCVVDGYPVFSGPEMMPLEGCTTELVPVDYSALELRILRNFKLPIKPKENQ
jgi:hypothetical protein